MTNNLLLSQISTSYFGNYAGRKYNPGKLPELQNDEINIQTGKNNRIFTGEIMPEKTVFVIPFPHREQ